MPLTLKQAAEETGLSKPAILKSIQKGKISAQKNKNGQWEIEPAELFRVYERHKPVNDEKTTKLTTGNTEVNDGLSIKNRELELKLEAAVKEIEMLKADKEDYKNRLDRESDERRKLTMMLTDMRDKSPEKPVEKKKGFWGSLFGS